jgi:histidinol-phosphate/aromatic aminotransferase/cobyric acid decarboxylase-like protein
VGYTSAPSQTDHFMVDTKRPGAPISNALARHSVMIGRTWANWPNCPRVSIGRTADMSSIQTAFFEVMQMPDINHNALAPLTRTSSRPTPAQRPIKQS